VSRLPATQRRGVARGLHARVVRIEPAPGGQADREIGVELVDRRIVVDGTKGTRLPGTGLHKPGMEEQLTRMIEV